jgi:hypothetical protein
MGDQRVARPLPTHKTMQTWNKRTQTSMSRVGFEPTNPEFERAKTVRSSDRTATVCRPRKITYPFIQAQKWNEVFVIATIYGKTTTSYIPKI